VVISVPSQAACFKTFDWSNLAYASGVTVARFRTRITGHAKTERSSRRQAC
jgi:hypothetical protein